MRWILFVATLCMFAAPAAAQRIDSPYRFVDSRQHAGAFAGYFITNTGSLDLGPESALVFGARYGLRVSGPFSLEASAALMPTSRAVQDTVISAGAQTDTSLVEIGSSDVTLALLNADLRFDLTGPRTWNGLMPFVMFGVGVAFAASDEENDAALGSDLRYRFGTALVGDFGAGVEWFPLEQWSVRVDARDVLWRLDAPEGLQQLDEPTEEWVQNFLFTAGVSWRF